jgi:hypothetical protein
MKTKKDKEYSKKHTKDRLSERYEMDITDEEYEDLCEMIKRRIDCTLVQVEAQYGGIQETYRVLFRGSVIYAVWNPQLQIIKTVLGEINIWKR